LRLYFTDFEGSCEQKKNSIEGIESMDDSDKHQRDGIVGKKDEISGSR
jgi:hypothetical protein